MAERKILDTQALTATGAGDWTMAERKDGVLTVPAIARALGVSDTKVKKIIKDPALESVAQKGACNFYSDEAMVQIKARLA